MKELPKTLVTLYAPERGGPVRFTDRQLSALQRAGVWESMKYTLLYCDYNTPTYSDAQVAGMLFEYEKRTHISTLPPESRHPTHPFLVGNPARADFKGCETFEAALTIAREVFLSDVATVPALDFKPEYHRVAEGFGIVLLVV